jgi:hypothetical protein
MKMQKKNIVSCWAGQTVGSMRAIQFAVTKLFGTGSQVPLLLVIDAI